MNTKNLFFGVLCLAIFSCEKANLKPQKEPQPVTQSNSSGNAADLSKFKKDIKIMAGENCEGYVILTISSNNQSYLNSYCKKYEKSKINLIPESSLQSEKSASENTDEAGSKNYVSIHMNLDHFVYKPTEEGHYALGFSNSEGQEKVTSFTYYSASGITFSSPVLAISIYNEYRKPFYTGSGRNNETARWIVNFMGGTQYPFTSAYFDYHENLDVHTFWDYGTSFPSASNSTYIAAPYTYNLRYRARYNYSGPALPSGAIETNGIMSATTEWNPYYLEWPSATITVYVL